MIALFFKRNAGALLRAKLKPGESLVSLAERLGFQNKRYLDQNFGESPSDKDIRLTFAVRVADLVGRTVDDLIREELPPPPTTPEARRRVPAAPDSGAFRQRLRIQCETHFPGAELELLLRRAGMSFTRYHEIIDGLALPDYGEMARLGEALGLPAAFLVFGWEPEASTPHERSTSTVAHNRGSKYLGPTEN